MMRRWAMSCLTVAWLTAGAGCAAINNMTGITETRELQRTGLAAEARIVRIWDTGMTLNNDPVVGFELEVHADGQTPFTATTKSPISRLDVPRFQPGNHVPVRYDPRDPTRVAIDVYQFK
jgi:hypothetical protein